MLHEYLHEEEEDEITIKELFAEPSLFKPRLSFKRRKNVGKLDTNMSIDSAQESQFRRKKMSRMASLASFITTPMKPVTRVGEAFQRSFSSSKISSPVIKRSPASSIVSSPSMSMKRSLSSITRSFSNSSSDSNGSIKYKFPTPTRRKPRIVLSWSNTLASERALKLPIKEIKRQEAIYELYRGEEDIIADLKTVQKVYHDSLLNLKLLTPVEIEEIFGNIFELIPVHEQLVDLLKSLRDNDGITHTISETMQSWIPLLGHYVSYCSNLVKSKVILDEKRSIDAQFKDFLQRCQESPFSRKLDLWNFLDVPRNRLMKYPLLLKEILKYTECDSSDCINLPQVSSLLSAVIQQVDLKTGQQECMLTLQKLEFMDDGQKDSAFHQASQVVCSGMLRNSRGTKLHVILFDTVLVLTRKATRSRGLVYQVWKNPIPIPFLTLDEHPEEEARKGSFRSTLSSSQKRSKYLFKIGSSDPVRAGVHNLIAVDEHNKKQWIMCIKKVICNYTPESVSYNVEKSIGLLEKLAESVHSFKHQGDEIGQLLNSELKLRGVLSTPMKAKSRQSRKSTVDIRSLKAHPGMARGRASHTRTRSWSNQNGKKASEYQLRYRRKCASSSNLLDER